MKLTELEVRRFANEKKSERYRFILTSVQKGKCIVCSIYTNDIWSVRSLFQEAGNRIVSIEKKQKYSVIKFK